jgi:hypothetical protein
VRMPNIKANVTHHLWDGCSGESHEAFFPLLSSSKAWEPSGSDSWVNVGTPFQRRADGPSWPNGSRHGATSSADETRPRATPLGNYGVRSDGSSAGSGREKRWIYWN